MEQRRNISRTTFAVVFLLDISHLVTSGASHFAPVGVILAVGGAQRCTVNAVTIAVTSFRTLTSSCQTIQWWDTLSTKTASFVAARITSICWEYVAAKTYWSMNKSYQHNNDHSNWHRCNCRSLLKIYHIIVSTKVWFFYIQRQFSISKPNVFNSDQLNCALQNDDTMHDWLSDYAAADLTSVRQTTGADWVAATRHTTPSVRRFDLLTDCVHALTAAILITLILHRSHYRW